MHTIKILSTPEGVRFGLLGDKPPAPTLFLFALDLEQTLTSDYGKIGHLLQQHGFLCVSLDVPGHGEDADSIEPNALRVWRNRIEHSENPIRDFTAKVSTVLDYLIEHGYSAAKRIAVSGTSRGGFLATHVAAADDRILCAAPIAPVADLLQLNEFNEVSNREVVESLSLIHLAPRLINRSLWITIGNNDARVNTDSTIAFTRSVVQAAIERGQEADIELHVVAEAGHVTPRGAHEQAATWLLDRITPRT